MINNQTGTVWDLYVRLFHWNLVASFAIAWLSADSWKDLHEWAGYCAVLLISSRLIWGLTGSHYARFRQFVRSPSSVLAFLHAMRRREDTRYLGHNPAGGAMIVALMLVGHEYPSNHRSTPFVDGSRAYRWCASCESST